MRIVLLPLVSRSECFLRNLLWVFDEHIAQATSHVNMCQHTNPLTPLRGGVITCNPERFNHLLKVTQ